MLITYFVKLIESVKFPCSSGLGLSFSVTECLIGQFQFHFLYMASGSHDLALSRISNRPANYIPIHVYNRTDN